MNESENFHYTVSELIETLRSFPPDFPVLTSGYENGYENIQEPVLQILRHKTDAPYYDGEFQPASDAASGIFEAVVLARLVRDV
jgi:hypothetical protein